MFYRFAVTTVLCLSLCVQSAWAAPDPKDTVAAMIGKFKSGAGFQAMLEYVHWPTAFNRLPAEQRKAMGVMHAQDLEKITEEFLTDPAAALEKRMGDQMKSLAPEQQTMMKNMLQQQQIALRQQMEESQKKMQRAEYVIGESSIAGNKATVEVTATVDGKSEKRPIDLELVDGKWYLPTSNLSGMGAKPQGIAVPAK